MTKFALTFLALNFLAPLAWSQDRIYRCGNEYTNNAAQAKSQGCKLVEGGNITVVPGTRVSDTAPAGAGTAASGNTANKPARIDSQAQRTRDADSRAILEAELAKAEARQAELKREYNDGNPQRTALELRNPQGYIQRTTELKSSLARAESDVAGIRRELGRAAPAAAPVVSSPPTDVKLP